jgi:hypothetical protein
MDIREQSCDTKMGSEGWDSVRTVITRPAKNVKNHRKLGLDHEV